MDAVKVSRLCLLLFLLQVISAYEIPPVKIEALKPKGLKASIPDADGNNLFVFQGHLNRPIRKGQVGSLSGEITQAKNGYWTYEDPNVELKVGDVVKYYVLVGNNKKGYLRDNQEFTIQELTDGSSPAANTPPSPTSEQPTPSPPNCLASITSVRGKREVCSGSVIFEETFDTLKEDKWQIHQYIPVEDYGYPFVSYQWSAVSTNDGNLQIIPKLLQNEPGYTNESIYMGKLDLSYGCTSIDACYAEATGWNILPPVVSGKITTKEFAFTYGIIEIRAKLPLGDWLYPELHLESLLKKYGKRNHVSGIMKMAGARGNKALSNGASNAALYGGLIATSNCKDTISFNKELTSFPYYWGEEFHTYSVEWRPDTIIFRVNGQEWGRAAGKLREKFPPSCGFPLLGKGAPDMAPFDHHFFISLSLAAGGITEFPDGVTTSGAHPKPWSNAGVKAKLNYWMDSHNWLPTWKDPRLLIDYVKVTAL